MLDAQASSTCPLTVTLQLAEKKYPYIYVSPTNQAHILIPVTGGTQIGNINVGTDNTCKATEELKNFFLSQTSIFSVIKDFIETCQKNLKLLRIAKASVQNEETSFLYDQEEELLKTLEQYQKLLSAAFPFSFLVGIIDNGVTYPPPLKLALKDPSANAVGMLFCPTKTHYYLNVESPLFSLNRKPFDPENWPHQLTLDQAAQLEPFRVGLIRSLLPLTEKFIKKERVVTGLSAGLQQLAEKETSLLPAPSESDEMWFNRIRAWAEQQVQQKFPTLNLKVGIMGQPSTESLYDFVRRIETLSSPKEIADPVEKSSYNKDRLLEIIEALINGCLSEESFQLLLSPFATNDQAGSSSGIEDLELAEEASIKIQLLLGIINLCCFEKTEKKLNLGQFLESSEPQRIRFFEMVTTAFQNQEAQPVEVSLVESLKADFSQEFDGLSQVTAEEIKEKFAGVWTLLKSSVHFDEVWMLPFAKNPEAHFYSDGSHIGLDFREYLRLLGPSVSEEEVSTIPYLKSEQSVLPRLSRNTGKFSIHIPDVGAVEEDILLDVLFSWNGQEVTWKALSKEQVRGIKERKDFPAVIQRFLSQLRTSQEYKEAGEKFSLDKKILLSLSDLLILETIFQMHQRKMNKPQTWDTVDPLLEGIRKTSSRNRFVELIKKILGIDYSLEKVNFNEQSQVVLELESIEQVNKLRDLKESHKGSVILSKSMCQAFYQMVEEIGQGEKLNDNAGSGKMRFALATLLHLDTEQITMKSRKDPASLSKLNILPNGYDGYLIEGDESLIQQIRSLYFDRMSEILDDSMISTLLAKAGLEKDFSGLSLDQQREKLEAVLEKLELRYLHMWSVGNSWLVVLADVNSQTELRDCLLNPHSSEDTQKVEALAKTWLNEPKLALKFSGGMATWEKYRFSLRYSRKDLKKTQGRLVIETVFVEGNVLNIKLKDTLNASSGVSFQEVQPSYAYNWSVNISLSDLPKVTEALLRPKQPQIQALENPEPPQRYHQEIVFSNLESLEFAKKNPPNFFGEDVSFNSEKLSARALGLNAEKVLKRLARIDLSQHLRLLESVKAYTKPKKGFFSWFLEPSAKKKRAGIWLRALLQVLIDPQQVDLTLARRMFFDNIQSVLQDKFLRNSYEQLKRSGWDLSEEEYTLQEVQGKLNSYQKKRRSEWFSFPWLGGFAKKEKLEAADLLAKEIQNKMENKVSAQFKPSPAMTQGRLGKIYDEFNKITCSPKAGKR